jgi:hypothetical protein
MAVYTVFSQRAWPEGSGIVSREYPPPLSFQAADQIWFVRDTGTPREVGLKLGINPEGGGVNNLIITRVAGSYWGRAPSDLWDWLKTAIEAESNG